MRYFIIDLSNFTIKEVQDDSWFSNPIKKLGQYNDLMCRIDAFGGYDAKYSWASRRNYYAEFFVRGNKSQYRIKRWTFPNEIRNATDSSSRDGRIFNEFSFRCTMPNGNPLNVKVKVNKPYIWGIIEAVSKLINMSETCFNLYSYEIRGERYIFLNSYAYYNSGERAYPL